MPFAAATRYRRKSIAVIRWRVRDNEGRPGRTRRDDGIDARTLRVDHRGVNSWPRQGGRRGVGEAPARPNVSAGAFVGDRPRRPAHRGARKEWLQGKIFEATTPFGPYLVTADEAGEAPGRLRTEVDGETVQQADIGDLVFDPAHLISYLSTDITLEPGDVIATGTPGGVGHARTPARYLVDGNVLTTAIEGLGECRNRCVAEKPHDA
ncbi:hypothetical protein GTZ85_10185 [Streptomyces sp. SID5474]|nr:hypothetical protein [Streptomyces sp. SID5474]